MVSLVVQTNAQGFHHSEVADHEKGQDAVVGSCPWTVWFITPSELQCTGNDVQEGGILRERRSEGGCVSEGQESTLGGDEMYAKRVLQIELPQVVR